MIISNVPKGGIVHSRSVREEYEFHYWLQRLYKRWREPHISGVCNIIWNALGVASGGYRHGDNSMSCCAGSSLVMRDYPKDLYMVSYSPVNHGRLLGRDRKVAAALKAHRAAFVKPSDIPF